MSHLLMIELKVPSDAKPSTYVCDNTMQIAKSFFFHFDSISSNSYHIYRIKNKR